MKLEFTAQVTRSQWLDYDWEALHRFIRIFTKIFVHLVLLCWIERIPQIFPEASGSMILLITEVLSLFFDIMIPVHQILLIVHGVYLAYHLYLLREKHSVETQLCEVEMLAKDDELIIRYHPAGDNETAGVEFTYGRRSIRKIQITEENLLHIMGFPKIRDGLDAAPPFFRKLFNFAGIDNFNIGIPQEHNQAVIKLLNQVTEG